MNEQSDIKDVLPEMAKLISEAAELTQIDPVNYCHLIASMGKSGGCYELYMNDTRFSGGTPRELLKQVASHNPGAEKEKKIQKLRAELAKLESELAGKGAE